MGHLSSVTKCWTFMRQTHPEYLDVIHGSVHFNRLVASIIRIMLYDTYMICTIIYFVSMNVLLYIYIYIENIVTMPFKTCCSPIYIYMLLYYMIMSMHNSYNTWSVSIVYNMIMYCILYCVLYCIVWYCNICNMIMYHVIVRPTSCHVKVVSNSLMDINYNIVTLTLPSDYLTQPWKMYHLQKVYLLKMVILHGYVKQPDGNSHVQPYNYWYI